MQNSPQPHLEVLRLEARQLIRRLVSLAEHRLRRGLALQFLNDGSAANCVQVWRHLERADQNADALVARLAIIEVLNREEISYERIADLYLEAKEAGYLSLCFLLRSRPAVTEASTRRPKDEAPLGQRISAARITPSQEIHRVLHDPDPKVIASLLTNPQITEADVVRIAARQPTTGEAQLELLCSEKWLKRYAIRRAVALNPCTPIDLSLRLLGFLRATDLRFVCTSPSLPLALREAAQYLLDEENDGP